MESELEYYLRIIGQADFLTPDEEKTVIAAVQEKGTDCPELQKLVEANARFILALAGQYRKNGTTYGELIEAARIAIHKAAMQYNIEDVVPFSKFAIPFIREEMQVCCITK